MSIFFWQRPIGAGEEVRRLTICAASSAPVSSCWALPLTTTELLGQLRAVSVTTLEIVNSELLDQSTWIDICEGIVGIHTLDSIHILHGCSDDCNALLLKRLQKKLHVLHIHDPNNGLQRTLKSLEQCNNLRELKIMSVSLGLSSSEQGLVESILRILPRLKRFALHDSVVDPEFWQSLVQNAETQTTCMTFACITDGWQQYVDMLACINALRLERQHFSKRSKVSDDAFVVWKDWFRSTHRPVRLAASIQRPCPVEQAAQTADCSSVSDPSV